MSEQCPLYPKSRHKSWPKLRARRTNTQCPGAPMLHGRRTFPSNAVRGDKAKNAIFWAGINTLTVVPRPVPDNRLPNGICGLNYRLWRYRVPLAIDRYPILTLPHIVASAVTIGVRATRHSIGGPKMLKPLTHFRRNVRELPAVHCNRSRADCS